MPQIKIFFVFLRHGKKEHYNHRTRSACIRRLRIQTSASRYPRDRWRRGLSSGAHPPDQYYARQGPGNSELCWAYGMLATIESEHIMKGDSVNLSIAYIARMMLEEQALEYYFAQGKKNISLRGTAPMLIHYIDKYGAQPYDSYEDPKHVNYKVLCRKVQKLCDGAISKKAGISSSRRNWTTCLTQK